MFIESVFDKWDKVESKIPKDTNRVEYMKKLLLFKNGTCNLNKLRDKLQAESYKYDEAQFLKFKLLNTVFDAFDYYFKTNEFPVHIDDIDAFINSVIVAFKNKANKVVKVMDINKLLDLYPTSIAKDEGTKYSPVDLFNMFGVFSSIHMDNKSYILDRTKYDSVLCLEDKAHFDFIIKEPKTDLTDAYSFHMGYLVENNMFRFNVAYIPNTQWTKDSRGVSLNFKINNKKVRIPNSRLKLIKSDLGDFYITSLKAKDYSYEVHLLC